MEVFAHLAIAPNAGIGEADPLLRADAVVTMGDATAHFFSV